MSAYTPISDGSHSTPHRLPFSTPKRGHSATTARSAPRGRINTPSSARKTPGDRFIPNRAATDIDFASYKVNSSVRAVSANTPTVTLSPSDVEKRKTARDRLFSLKGCSSETRVLNFRQTQATCSSGGRNTPGKYQYWSSYTSCLSSSAKKKARKVPKSADRVLDAPNMVNDFYLNLLDWSKRGHLAIALAGSVYLLDTTGGSNSIHHLCNMEAESTYVSSLQWNKSGKYLALGTSDSEIQLWDVNACKLVRRMRSHDSRVSSLAWNGRSGLLSSGSQSGQVHNYDPRVALFHKHVLKAHTMDVCGLRWSPNGRFLASGGNDNIVNVWDTMSRDPWSAPAHTFKDHTAAVKALAWCPWQPSLLATGGGSADRHIRLWNASNGRKEVDLDTGSQVTGLLWSSTHRELLSAHGHPHNELILWRQNTNSNSPSLTLSRIADLPGHDDRILHVALSPDGQTVASVGSDETLRFWKCFPINSEKTKENQAANLSFPELSMPNYIR